MISMLACVMLAYDGGTAQASRYNGSEKATSASENGKKKKKEKDTNHACHKQKSIVVLYENDVHCAVDGYAKLAGLRDAIADTAHVFLVSNGDYVQGQTVGAISKGQYVVDIMKTIGYDAITLGNHEFDYGMERMFELLRQVPAPIVCCNLYDVRLGRSVFAPYVMKRVGSGYRGVCLPR